MTDNEIKKALECCIQRTECKQCGLLGTSDCMTRLYEHALDLINRQKAEIERLKAEVMAKEEEYNDMLHQRNSVEKHLETAKAEAYKEFAERLNERTTNKFWDGNKMHELKVPLVGVDDIDNLLKEMVGDSK